MTQSACVCVYVFDMLQKVEEDSSQLGRLSKLNGLKKAEPEETREMITPALREALTKQGTDTCVQCEKRI